MKERNSTNKELSTNAMLKRKNVPIEKKNITRKEPNN